jgi:fatty-acyl-CoA synthase
MSILNESQAGRIAEIGKRGEATDRGDLAPQDDTSYLRGADQPPLSYITIPALLRQAVALYGPRDALVCPAEGVRLSYYELDRAVDELAGGFLAMGLARGDRVGIWAPNRSEWVLTQFATARLGLILVNINPAYRVAELEFALHKVGCKVLVTARSFKSSDYLAMLRDLMPELDRAEPGRLDAAKLPALRGVIVLGDRPVAGCLAFDDVRRLGGPAQQLRLSGLTETLSPDDAINIQFTSGTTGAPKGATLSHYNIVNNARFVTDRIALTEADRLCIPVPLYHCFGMVMGVLGAVSKGAAMVFPGEAFDAETTVRTLEAEACTAVYGVPTMFVAMLQTLETSPRNLTSLRTGIMAGAPCPVDVMHRVMDRMHMTEVTICYGMTETAPVSFQSFTDDPVDKRCETVGRVHPHLEVKIVDPDGRIVPVGTQGELCTRGYSVMKGYWDEPEKTAEAVRDGWMHTGDLAVLDAEGFCSITGRVKDMIIRGGENIYPREVEEFLFRHPAVSEVQVFGVPDEKYGEEVAAFVIAKPGQRVTAEELRDFCTGQIAHYKVPRHIRLVDSLPMTITGKPQKFVMRERMLAMLKSPEEVPPMLDPAQLPRFDHVDRRYDRAVRDFRLEIPEHFNFAFDVLDARAREADKTAILAVARDGETVRRVSYAELATASGSFAAALRRLGAKKGDAACVVIGRVPEWHMVLFGCMKAGVVSMPGTTLLTAKDIAYRINQAGARLAIVAPEHCAKVDAIRADCPTLKHLIAVGEAPVGWLSFEALCAAEGAGLDARAAGPFRATDTMMIYFTSGTTALPKMVPRDYGYALAHAATALFWMDLREDDIHWTLTDTGWAKAAWGLLFPPMLMGATILLFDAAGFDAGQHLGLIGKHKVTTFCAPPTAYRMFAQEDLSAYDLTTLRRSIGAGEPLNPEVIRIWQKHTGTVIADGYGQTETINIVGNFPGMEPRLGSMGKPVPGFDVDVIDDEGNRLPQGEVGHIAVNVLGDWPPGLFHGYLRDGALDTRPFHGDWYLTGDTAHRDADGYLWFAARADDLISSAGYRISPFEVESVLLEHPAVMESAVVGEPDETRGQVVKAYIVLANGHAPSDALARDIQEFCKRATAPYKYPRIVEFTRELPKTISGKIRRVELRETPAGRG